MKSNQSKNKSLQIFSITISLILSAILIFLIFYNVQKVKRIKNYAQLASTSFGIETSLIVGIIRVESNFNCKAVSNKGAKGLMQITDDTFIYTCKMYTLDYKVEDIFDEQINIIVGTCYLKYLFTKFKSVNEVLASYNAGETNVRSWLKDKSLSKDGKTLDNIPFLETKKYVEKVNYFYNYYKEKLNESNSSKSYKNNT